MARNIAVVEIDFPTLGKLLNLPPGQFVVRAEYDICRDGLRVLIEGDGLPSISEGGTALSLRLLVEKVERAEVRWPKDVSGG